jgi:glycosyltransferase involved in cell wall biosynthesis
VTSRPDLLRVLHVLATNQRRGGETYAADLVRGLSGHDVDQRVAVLRGVDDRELRFHAPAGVVGGGPRLPGVGVDLRAVRRLRRISWRWQPHVVHAHGGQSFKHAALAAGAGGATLVYGRIGAAWIRSGPRAWAYGRLMRRADRVFALAEALTRETVEVFGVPEDRVLTMPGGVDESFVRPTRGRDATREELAVHHGARVILSLGALAWEKDPLGQLEVATRALEKVPDAVYVVAGEGPLRPALEEAVRDLAVGDRVRVVGARSDVGDLLASADVLLLASRFEGVPRVVLEAGMAGVPSVAYAVAGIPETVESGETGLLATPGDADALAVAAVSLLTDDDLRRRLGETARRRYRARFGADVVARAHLAVYRELAAAR